MSTKTMTEHPILVTAEMVRAILDGRKTQTRRVIKPQPVILNTDLGVMLRWTPNSRKPEEYVAWPADMKPHACALQGLLEKCPYGVPGDLLWVREGFRCTGGGSWKGVLYRADGGDTAMSFCGVQDGRAKTIPSDFWPQWDHLVYETRRSCEWRPSTHMPQWACRLWLKVKSVRVERVQEITESDAICEGVQGGGGHPDFWAGAFRDLWDSINAKRGYSWETNPWVWVVEFERYNK